MTHLCLTGSGQVEVLAGSLPGSASNVLEPMLHPGIKYTYICRVAKLKLQNRILIHLDFQDFSFKFYVTKREKMY